MIMAENATQADVQVGQEAPDFTLKNEDGQETRLSELRGRPVVLVFYPFDWSGLCTAELCSIRDDYSSFEQRGATVLGISRDSIYSHKAWKEHMHYQHSLLADLKGTAARLYGAWNEDAARADRMTVVIDPQGIVRYVVHNSAGVSRDHHDALKALDALGAAV